VEDADPLRESFVFLHPLQMCIIGDTSFEDIPFRDTYDVFAKVKAGSLTTIFYLISRFNCTFRGWVEKHDQ
jgi:hypothetical protein